MATAAAATGACSTFAGHAFLRQKCRDCGCPQEAHTQNQAAASPKTDFSTGALSVLKPQRECSQYEPHAWIYDRCRDCGGSETSHTGAAGGDSAPEEMRRGSAMVVRHSAVDPNKKRNSMDGSSSGKQNVDINGLQFLEIGDVGHSQQQSEVAMAPALSPVQMRAQSADDQMSEVVAKANFLEQEYQRMQAGDKQRLADKQITQEEYDRNIAELQAAYAQKEMEVRQEAETARRTLEEANNLRQREIEENAARSIAEAQERARMQVEEAQLATRQILEEAEREKAEALAYKREAEDARALAQAEAQLQKRLAEEAHAQAAQSRTEADQARVQVQQMHEAAEVVVAAQTDAAALALDSDELQPAAPMHATAVSHEPEAQLSDVLKNVERLFVRGCNVVRYSAHRPGTFSSLFIRQIDPAAHPTAAVQGATGSSVGAASATTPSYALCWGKADERTVHPSRCLNFTDIAAVVLGKQSTVFRTQAPSAPERCCVSFIAGSGVAASSAKSLHVQFGSPRDADTWAYGVASLVKELGAKPGVFEEGQYFEQEAERARDMDLAREEHDDGARPAVQADLDALVASAAGSAARYQVELAVKCAGLATIHGNVIVCLVDRDEHTNKLRYLNQTDRVSETNSPVFRKRFPLVYLDCPPPKTLRLNVYDVPSNAATIDDEHRLGSAVVSIKALVDRPDAEFVYTLSHKQPQKQAALTAAGSTITVSCVSKRLMAVDADAMAAHSGIPLLGEEERRLRDEIRATERTLAQGDVFHNYVENAPAQNITMLYVPSTDGSAAHSAAAAVGGTSAVAPSRNNPFDRFELGSLQWSVVGAKAQLLPLRSVVDVFVGKKSPSFPADTADDRAFSLVSKGGVRLDLEAKSRQQRDSWVQGIISLLKAAAAQQQKDKAAAAARAAAHAQDPHSASTSVASAVQPHHAQSGVAPQLHHAQADQQQHAQMAPVAAHPQ